MCFSNYKYHFIDNNSAYQPVFQHCKTKVKELFSGLNNGKLPCNTNTHILNVTIKCSALMKKIRRKINTSIITWFQC